mmetsp:Transcript_27096/g.40891  ORF Transcript_27096/g.40891 Transcript_27096/m.40891 type:complete len:408 (-) Transcript_27096:84-1307(-)
MDGWMDGWRRSERPHRPGIPTRCACASSQRLHTMTGVCEKLMERVAHFLHVDLDELALLRAAENLQLGPWHQEGLLLIGIDRERCDVHRTGRVESEERRGASQLLHEVLRDRLVGRARGDSPPRDHLSFLVLVVEVRRDATPQRELLLWHRSHRLEEQTQVAHVRGNVLVKLTQRKVELAVDRVARVQNDGAIAIRVEGLDRLARFLLGQLLAPLDAAVDRRVVRDVLRRLLECLRHRQVEQPFDRILELHRLLLHLGGSLHLLLARGQRWRRVGHALEAHLQPEEQLRLLGAQQFWSADRRRRDTASDGGDEGVELRRERSDRRGVALATLEHLLELLQHRLPLVDLLLRQLAERRLPLASLVAFLGLHQLVLAVVLHEGAREARAPVVLRLVLELLHEGAGRAFL